MPLRCYECCGSSLIPTTMMTNRSVAFVEPVRTTLLALPELIDKDDREHKGDVRSNCPDTFDGIGIILNWSGQVVQVAKGWPADRAGVRVGDTIVGGVNGHRAPGRLPQIHLHGRDNMLIKTENVCIREEPMQ